MENNDDWLIGKLTVFRHNHDYDWIMDRVKEWAYARDAWEAEWAAWEAGRDARAAEAATRHAEWVAKQAARDAESAAVLARVAAAWDAEALRRAATALEKLDAPEMPEIKN
jgi:hypothetical protein